MSSFIETPIKSVQDFWDERPCNIRHSPKQVGSKKYFDEVEQRKYFVEPHIPTFTDFPKWKEKRVLEIGCGIGTDTINFARAGALVTAIDLSPKSIAITEQRAKVYGFADRISLVCGNVEELDQYVPIEQFDLVYSFGVIHHTPNPPRAIEQISQFMSRNSELRLMLYSKISYKLFGIMTLFLRKTSRFLFDNANRAHF